MRTRSDAPAEIYRRYTHDVDVRGSLLALLTLGPCHGAQLAAELADRTGEGVNAGQVAKTLLRLEAEGLVESRPRDASGRIPFGLTARGRLEAAVWLDTPAIDGFRLAIAASMPGADRAALLASQRTALDVLFAGLPEPRALAAPRRRGRPARRADAV